jgi:deoxyribose-phosphate aldolase
VTAAVPAGAVPAAEVVAFLDGLPPVDAREVADTIADMPKLEPGGRSRLESLDLALALTDLTTLEGTDTPERVRALCATAARPDPDDDSGPPVATVCVYSDLVGVAAAALAGSPVGVAGVAGTFPSGRAPLGVRVADVRAAVEAGADEIDLVLDRGAFLDGRQDQAYAELVALREACAGRRLKVILENSELRDLDDVQRASWLALLAGADMVKTSTGKSAAGGATMPDVLVMLRAARAYGSATGRTVGVKASGGIRTADDALAYLALVDRAVSPDWLSPDRFRFGASSLVTDLARARRSAA